MDNTIFDEVEHWLAFIKNWEHENNEQVPEDVIIALEMALNKATFNYRNRDDYEKVDKYFH